MRTRVATTVWVVLIMATFMWPCAAYADPAGAQKLFEEAVALRDQGRWQEACRKFAASMQLDPSVGTLLNVAGCHEREGKLATALAAYERARVMNRATPDPARRAQVDQHVTRSVAALRPRVPLLAITVAPPLAGLEVTRSGAPLPLAALGEELPVDPGEVVARAQAPGYAGEARITVAPGERKRLHITLIAGVTPRPTGAIPVWAWLSGGLGIAFVGVAVGSAIWYADTVNELEERCGAQLVPCTPDPPGSYDPADDNRAKNTALGLGIGFGVAGGGGILAAIIGIATAGSPARQPRGTERLRVVPSTRGIGVRLRF